MIHALVTAFARKGYEVKLVFSRGRQLMLESDRAILLFVCLKRSVYSKHYFPTKVGDDDAQVKGLGQIERVLPGLGGLTRDGAFVRL
jgi:hypothetical protein